MTDTRKRSEGGDASFESNKRRKKVTILRLESKPKGLLEESQGFSKVIWIKTNNAFWQGTTEKSAKVAHCKMSLVAGNVTGGGGKATKQKPIGIKF